MEKSELYAQCDAEDSEHNTRRKEEENQCRNHILFLLPFSATCQSNCEPKPRNSTYEGQSDLLGKHSGNLF